MRRITFIISAFILMFSLGLAAQQRGGGQRGGDRNPEEMVKKMVEEMKKELTLTADQEKQVNDLLVKNMKKRQESFKEGERPNREKMQEEFKKQQEEQNAELKKILTEDQYKKYTEFQEKRRKDMESRGRGGERPKRN